MPHDAFTSRVYNYFPIAPVIHRGPPISIDDAMAKLDAKIQKAFSELDRKYGEAAAKIDKRYKEKSDAIDKKYKEY